MIVLLSVRCRVYEEERIETDEEEVVFVYKFYSSVTYISEENVPAMVDSELWKRMKKVLVNPT